MKHKYINETSHKTLLEQGEIEIEKVKAGFENLDNDLQYGLAIQYLINQSGGGDFGLISAINQMIEDLEYYRDGLAEPTRTEELTAAMFFEKVESQFCKEAIEKFFAKKPSTV